MSIFCSYSTEIRCKPLSTASTQAICTYNDDWISCESPVPLKTTATVSCRNSYRSDTTILTTQRKNVKCNARGQWEPEPIKCSPGPIIINIMLNETIISFQNSFNENCPFSRLMDMVNNKSIAYDDDRTPRNDYPDIDVRTHG